MYRYNGWGYRSPGGICNGTHHVNVYRVGFVRFPGAGNIFGTVDGFIEYLAWLSFPVTVSGGRITSMGTPRYTMEHLFHWANASWALGAIPSSFIATSASATANYTVTFSLFIEGVPLRSSTLPRFFGVTALLVG